MEDGDNDSAPLPTQEGQALPGSQLVKENHALREQVTTLQAEIETLRSDAEKRREYIAKTVRKVQQQKQTIQQAAKKIKELQQALKKAQGGSGGGGDGEGGGHSAATGPSSTKSNGGGSAEVSAPTTAETSPRAPSTTASSPAGTPRDGGPAVDGSAWVKSPRSLNAKEFAALRAALGQLQQGKQEAEALTQQLQQDVEALVGLKQLLQDQVQDERKSREQEVQRLEEHAQSAQAQVTSLNAQLAERIDQLKMMAAHDKAVTDKFKKLQALCRDERAKNAKLKRALQHTMVVREAVRALRTQCTTLKTNATDSIDSLRTELDEMHASFREVVTPNTARSTPPTSYSLSQALLSSKSPVRNGSVQHGHGIGSSSIPEDGEMVSNTDSTTVAAFAGTPTTTVSSVSSLQAANGTVGATTVFSSVAAVQQREQELLNEIGELQRERAKDTQAVEDLQRDKKKLAGDVLRLKARVKEAEREASVLRGAHEDAAETPSPRQQRDTTLVASLQAENERLRNRTHSLENQLRSCEADNEDLRKNVANVRSEQRMQGTSVEGLEARIQSLRQRVLQQDQEIDERDVELERQHKTIARLRDELDHASTSARKFDHHAHELEHNLRDMEAMNRSLQQNSKFRMSQVTTLKDTLHELQLELKRRKEIIRSLRAQLREMEGRVEDAQLMSKEEVVRETSALRAEMETQAEQIDTLKMMLEAARKTQAQNQRRFAKQKQDLIQMHREQMRMAAAAAAVSAENAAATPAGSEGRGSYRTPPIKPRPPKDDGSSHQRKRFGAARLNNNRKHLDALGGLPSSIISPVHQQPAERRSVAPNSREYENKQRQQRQQRQLNPQLESPRQKQRRQPGQPAVLPVRRRHRNAGVPDPMRAQNHELAYGVGGAGSMATAGAGVGAADSDVGGGGRRLGGGGASRRVGDAPIREGVRRVSPRGSDRGALVGAGEHPANHHGAHRAPLRHEERLPDDAGDGAARRAPAVDMADEVPDDLDQDQHSVTSERDPDEDDDEYRGGGDAIVAFMDRMYHNNSDDQSRDAEEVESSADEGTDEDDSENEDKRPRGGDQSAADESGDDFERMLLETEIAALDG